MKARAIANRRNLRIRFPCCDGPGHGSHGTSSLLREESTSAEVFGQDAPDGGGAISCPLPGHEDAHPSFMVYADPARGWRCFSHPGGPIGGRIYDLAAALTGGPVGVALGGAAFLEAKRCAEQRLGYPARDESRALNRLSG